MNNSITVISKCAGCPSMPKGCLSYSIAGRNDIAAAKAMLNKFPNRETVEKLRREYPPGTRVELAHMNDPYSKLTTGDKGTVICVDDIGTIFCSWDSGSSLGIVYGEDFVRKL